MIYKLIPILMLFTILLSSAYASDINVQDYLANPSMIKDVNVGPAISSALGNSTILLNVKNDDGTTGSYYFKVENGILNYVSDSNESTYEASTSASTLQEIVDSEDKAKAFKTAYSDGRFVLHANGFTAYIRTMGIRLWIYFMG